MEIVTAFDLLMDLMLMRRRLSQSIGDASLRVTPGLQTTVYFGLLDSLSTESRYLLASCLHLHLMFRVLHLGNKRRIE